MSSMEDEYDVSFVREEMLIASPPPTAERGVILWLRQNLFSSWSNTIATLFILYILYLIIPPFIDFVLTNARLDRNGTRGLLHQGPGRRSAERLVRRMLVLCRRLFQPVHLRPLPGRGTLARRHRLHPVLWRARPARHPPGALQDDQRHLHAARLSGRRLRAPDRRAHHVQGLPDPRRVDGAVAAAVRDRVRDHHGRHHGDHLCVFTRLRPRSAPGARHRCGDHGGHRGDPVHHRHQLRPALRRDQPLGRPARHAGHRRHRHRRVAAARHPACTRPAFEASDREELLGDLHRVLARRAADHGPVHGLGHAAAVPSRWSRLRQAVPRARRCGPVCRRLYGRDHPRRPSGDPEGAI